MRIADQRHVVVIGAESDSLSELGLRLARRLHRPFLDNCSLVGISERDRATDSGVRHRLERMLAQSTPSVITLSTDVELPVPACSDVDESSRPWVVVVDGCSSIGALDGVAHADMLVDPTEAADYDVVDRVVEQFHSARR